METRKERTARPGRLRRVAAACAICFAALSCATAPNSRPVGDPTPAVKPDGQALYAKNCAKCHGDDGRARGLRGWLVGARDLTDAKWQVDRTDEQIANAIRLGPKAMPAFEEKLAAAEIAALVGHVRHLKAAK